MPVEVQIPHHEEARIVVDGLADETAWADAPVIDQFVVYHPEPDIEPMGEMEVRVLTDNEGIYFHFQVTDPEPEKMRLRYTRRDRVFGSETVGIYLDPFADAQQGYLFVANALGVQADATRLANVDDRFSWDGRWDSVGLITADGYQVEVHIPWTTVRHPATADQLGLSLFRSIGRNGQRSGWPRRDPDVQGILVQQALVGGPGTLPRGGQVQALPEVTFGISDQGLSAERWSAGGVAPGLTVRADPSAALTMLGTVNPDFSQVESDQAQIDVNERYMLSVREKRPFFLEGGEWFETVQEDLVYTRAIVLPRYGVRATVEQHGITVAALHVLDGSPAGSVSEGESWSDEDLEGQQALSSLLRVRSGVGKDGFVGAIASDRTVVGTEMANRLAGADTQLRLSDHWVLRGMGTGSTTGLADGSSLSGMSACLGALGESRWGEIDVYSFVTSPGFRAENGFVTVSDAMGISTRPGLHTYPASQAIGRFTVFPLLGEAWWHTDRSPRLRQYGPAVEFRFNNATHLETGAVRSEEAFGGEWLVSDGGYADFRGSPTRWLGLGGGVYAGEAPYYDEANPFVGNEIGGKGHISIYLGRHVTLATETGAERFMPKEDADAELAYDALVTRNRVEVYFNRTFWIRLLTDYSTDEALWGGEGVLAWERSPGRALYMGGSAQEGGSWQAFAKAAWTFAP